jgi:hypothetical protein
VQEKTINLLARGADVAIDLLKTRPDIGVIYVHTTDYPMHMWAPDRGESQEHLARLDALIGAAVETAPDAAFFLTANHGMSYKKRCWDLDKALGARGSSACTRCPSSSVGLIRRLCGGISSIAARRAPRRFICFSSRWPTRKA